MPGNQELLTAALISAKLVVTSRLSSADEGSDSSESHEFCIRKISHFTLTHNNGKVDVTIGVLRPSEYGLSLNPESARPVILGTISNPARLDKIRETFLITRAPVIEL